MLVASAGCGEERARRLSAWLLVDGMLQRGSELQARVGESAIDDRCVRQAKLICSFTTRPSATGLDAKRREADGASTAGCRRLWRWRTPAFCVVVQRLIQSKVLVPGVLYRTSYDSNSLCFRCLVSAVVRTVSVS